jgi:glutathione S-transferase
MARAMTVDEFFAAPATRLFAAVWLLLVLKMMAVGSYTSVIRIRRRIYATPEDYALVGLAPRPSVDEDIERARRAHRNDLENVLPFFSVGLLYLLTRPSLGAARVYFIGFLVARVLHSVFYIASLQPHRTIAFAVGALLMLGMVVQGLAHFLT